MVDALRGPHSSPGAVQRATLFFQLKPKRSTAGLSQIPK